MRRVLVMAVAMVVAWILVGSAQAVEAGVAALLVGILDLRQPFRPRLWTMAIGTLSLAGTTLFTETFGFLPGVIGVLLVAIAFTEGAGIAVHRDVPVVMQLNGIIVATALLEPRSAVGGVSAALVVLAAGSVQTVASALDSWRVRGRHEAEVTAKAVEEVASALRQAATGDRRGALALERSARTMTAAQRTVTDGGSSATGLVELGRTLQIVDRLRVAGMAIVLGGGPVDETDVLRLTQLADAVDRQVVGLGIRPVHADVSARRSSAEHDSGGVVRRRRTVRHALRPGALAFRFGIRLAVAALLAAAVGATAGLVHASWAVTACLSVLRPDGGPTLGRIGLRAVATSAAALVVVGEAALLGDRPVAFAVMAVAFSFLMFWLGPTNYGLYGFFITVAVLSMLALASGDPRSMALGRWVDTLVGCAVALVAAFAVPAWRGRQVPDALATCCAALSREFTSLSVAVRTTAGARDLAAVRTAGRATRDAITDALTTFNVAELEPGGRGSRPPLRSAFEEVRSCARMGVLAEDLMARGHPARERAARLATETASELQGAAVGKRRTPDVPPAAPDHPPVGDRLEVVFELALSAARSVAENMYGVVDPA